MQRLTAFEAKLPQYRSQNVQVLGISVDDPMESAKWAKKIGVTFPLLSDNRGRLSQQLGLLDSASARSIRAVAVIQNGELVHTEQVITTEVPARLLPWIDKVQDENS
jgi:peroxiredoxin